MILRYITGTLYYGLFYTHFKDFLLWCYIENNYANNSDGCKSTLGYVFHLITNMISWESKKQPIVSISSTYEEYVVATSVAFRVVWLKWLLVDISNVQNETTIIYFDTNFAISLSKNDVFQKMSKHIDTHFLFIYELVNDGDILLAFCGSKDQLVDIFTKPLGKNVFEFQRERLGILSVTTCNSWYYEGVLRY